MAVRAEEHALARLRTQAGQRASATAVAEFELLRLRVEVVKLECPDASRVATQNASPSRLLHQNSLQAVPTTHGCLYPAPFTTVITAPLTNEVGLAMMPAAGHHLSRPMLCTLLAAPRWLETVSMHPMTDRPQAAIQSLRDLPKREASGKKLFHLLFLRRPLGRMPLRRGRLQPVLLHPVTHGRFVFADLLTNRPQRHSLRQTLLEELFVHGCIISNDADRKLRRRSIRRPAACGRFVRPGRRVRG
jgi:hypothetical protein